MGGRSFTANSVERLLGGNPGWIGIPDEDTCLGTGYGAADSSEGGKVAQRPDGQVCYDRWDSKRFLHDVAEFVEATKLAGMAGWEKLGQLVGIFGGK